jgi:hypothetical protein
MTRSRLIPVGHAPGKLAQRSMTCSLADRRRLVKRRISTMGLPDAAGGHKVT